jgi:hypothetical protein
LNAPKASFGGKDMYPSIHEKAAVYLYHIAIGEKDLCLGLT